MKIQDVQPSIQRGFANAVKMAEAAIAQRKREIANYERFCQAAAACMADESVGVAEMPETETADGEKHGGDKTGEGAGEGTGEERSPMAAIRRLGETARR